jgi:tetratricopeptide (TPR) repeat protein
MTVVFVLFQYPDLDVQTLFIGRVQYIQAHGIYALWISYGLVLALAFLDSRLPGSKIVRFGGIGMAFLLPLILISRNAFDREYLELAGCVEQNGHDFGWQFGHYQLQGIEAIRRELEEGEPPPPSSTFPPPMKPDAIFFGGTDPGRFVPTYMIYSAKVRPDVYLITQNALADNTYMSVMRDLYGDRIWIPAISDSNQAFAEYVNDVKAGRIPAGAEVTEKGGRVSVQGVQGVMMINGILSKQIFDANRLRHAFYVEESYVIPWMYPYLTPHGLIMKINRDPLPRIPGEIVQADHEFWIWYADRLLRNRKFLRDVVARKTFSKLRSSIGGLYVYRQLYPEAEFAFQQAVALYDLSPEANFRLADAYTKQGKFPQAIQVIETFLEKDPGNDKVRTYLGQLKDTFQQFERRAELEPMLAKGATLNVAMELLGIYRNLGQAGQFENLSREMISKPQLPPAVCKDIGDLSMSFRRFGMAVAAYQGVTQRAPSEYAGWIDLAAAHLSARQIQESVNALARAVQLGGDTARRDLRADQRFAIIHNSPAWKQLVPPPAPATLSLPFGGQ